MTTQIQDQSDIFESNMANAETNLPLEQTNRPVSPSNPEPGQQSPAGHDDLATPEANHPGNGPAEHASVNRVFLRGLATLLGQFGPNELDAHQPGLLRLVNDALADTGSHLPLFDADTPIVVIQRLAGQLAA